MMGQRASNTERQQKVDKTEGGQSRRTNKKQASRREGGQKKKGKKDKSKKKRSVLK